MHCGKKAVDAVDRVAQEVFPYFSIKKIIIVFGTLFNQYDFYNVVLKEFTQFQTEFIPEEYYIRKEHLQISGISRPSYWDDCYENLMYRNVKQMILNFMMNHIGGKYNTLKMKMEIKNTSIYQLWY